MSEYLDAAALSVENSGVRRDALDFVAPCRFLIPSGFTRTVVVVFGLLHYLLMKIFVQSWFYLLSPGLDWLHVLTLC